MKNTSTNQLPARFAGNVKRLWNLPSKSPVEDRKKHKNKAMPDQQMSADAAVVQFISEFLCRQHVLLPASCKKSVQSNWTRLMQGHLSPFHVSPPPLSMGFFILSLPDGYGDTLSILF